MNREKKQYRALTLLLMSVFLSACPGGDEPCPDPSKCVDFAFYVAPAISAIDGAFDDLSNAQYANKEQWRNAHIADLLRSGIFIDEAWAAACARPSTAICTDEVKTATYTDCDIGSTSFLYNGTVTLTYTGTANCGFAALGDAVIRTMSVNRSIPDNGIVSTTSDTNTDFRGNIIGGGTKLAIVGNNAYNLDILGLRKKLTKATGQTSYVSYDLLMRTTAPIGVTGGLSRSVRRINGGTLEVITERSYVYTFTPDNVTYNTDCCYPVAGSIRYASTSDSGTITFPACGSAKIERPGARSYSVLLESCE